MEIRNNTTLYQSRPTFKAHVESDLAKELITKAKEISPATLEMVKNQIKFVETWGHETSVISTSIDTVESTNGLSLFNSELSSSYGERLPQYGTLLSSFLNLRKSHILKAEKKIEETVFNNKLDLVVKALENDTLAERITGKVKPCDEELAAAIDRLSEEEITNFRFGLDRKPAETAKLLDFVV
ncbi:hypothetical protein J6P92_09500 [bacterium]|nr:hypothetical protein [bacterium]